MNPFQMIQILRAGPQAFINQFANSSQIANNPAARNALNMLQSGDNEGLRKMAENLCREHGTTPENVLRQIGLK